ncbi:MAG: ABC transporter ATP-binding protein [Nitriliruptorales bacterium]|nr:ABC transporter ATP-binding protein [Nitriliruptorales bacterium]
MLEIRGLRKAYGEVVALAGVDLDVPRGRIVSLLGPNGAGKTTLVSIVSGLRHADAGTVRVGDVDALRHPQQARQLIGLAPQELGLYPILTVRRNLQVFGELYGLRGTELESRIGETAAALGVDPLLDRKAGELSGGQKRRVHTAIALLHRPPLLLLDEATVGADIETRGELLGLVRRLAHEGKAAVLYTTHYLHEVEELGATVVIIDEGRVIAAGGVEDLIAEHAQPVVEVAFDGQAPLIDVSAPYEVEDDRIRVPSGEPARTAATLLASLGSDADRVRSVEIVRPSLEAVYLALTGKRYDPTGAGVEEEVSGVAAN